MKKQVSEIKVSYRPIRKEKVCITTSCDAAKLFNQFFPADTKQLQERFMVLYLNRSNTVIGIYPVSVGGITGTIADVRLILAVALKAAAVSLILAHNHPSGNLKPSRVDEDLTSKIKEAAQYMDIKVLDHLILGMNEGDYYSFADEGLL